ncbi:magnesium chelatase domain-containing protein [Phytomonospora endophytica]|uniref:Magnesium chelatase family protein n=1 Tax=Phytomonospora endophytica TaxID=714109 RepID=A0A841FWN0_9ACTN|nr:magnesium chelatase domain-containing protein [Phytomonospora endophytica]MBB6037747.1 magnesium chelatase family protein [Phytomonospora endophytica]GIG67726.1 hypothetical protein Pen01_40210 [Phytomonospora endophytica]
MRTISATGLDHHVLGIGINAQPDSETRVDLPGPREQRDRVRAAIINSSWLWPDGAVRLERDHADGELGSSADLALAIAVLIATGQAVAWPELADTLILGELGPDGSVRACRGVYPAVKAAKAAGLSRVIVPDENIAEAQLVSGIGIVGAGPSLHWVNSWLASATAADDVDDAGEPDPIGLLLVTADAETGDVTVESLGAGPVPGSPPSDRTDGIGVGRISVSTADLAEIPAHVLRAISLAAAGGHHMILTHEAPAGFAGDVAALLVGLLPPLSATVREEVMDLWSLAGALEPNLSAVIDGDSEMVAVLPNLLLDRLYGQPDHPARPGYMPLAHHGVLHLYDTAAIQGFALDVVAQTMSRRSVMAMSHSPYGRYPAEFQLLATTAACPKSHTPCTCRPEARVLHTQHIHDKLGAHAAINIAATEPAASFDPEAVPTAEKVATARIRAARRWGASQGAAYTNHTVPADMLRSVSDEGFAYGIHNDLAGLAAAGVLSDRHVELVQRLMWTIADYDGITAPGDVQLTQALALHLHTPKPH